jgi:hypothetical protein
MFPHFEGRAEITGVSKQSVEKIYGLERGDINEHMRVLHNEKFDDLYRFSSIVRIVKYRKRLYCKRQMAGTGKARNIYRIFVMKLCKKCQLI